MKKILLTNSKEQTEELIQRCLKRGLKAKIDKKETQKQADSHSVRYGGSAVVIEGKKAQFDIVLPSFIHKED
jgi:hypothetical protein